MSWVQISHKYSYMFNTNTLISRVLLSNISREKKTKLCWIPNRLCISEPFKILKSTFTKATAALRNVVGLCHKSLNFYAVVTTTTSSTTTTISVLFWIIPPSKLKVPLLWHLLSKVKENENLEGVKRTI